MDNIVVGDTLMDRDTRRVGREVKVIWVEKDHITVEVIADSINAKKSTVGTSTDIARNRLKKGYTLKETSTVEAKAPKKARKGERIVAVSEPDERQNDSATISIPEDSIVNDPVSLDDALNTAGFYWLPPVEVLIEAVGQESTTVTKTALVHLIHGIIRENLVTGQ